jgi:preprotein translocase subunit SecY
MVTMLALMDNNVRGVFYLVAVVLFLIAAAIPIPELNLVALGLAAFAIPFCYDAFAA